MERAARPWRWVVIALTMILSCGSSSSVEGRRHAASLAPPLLDGRVMKKGSSSSVMADSSNAKGRYQVFIGGYAGGTGGGFPGYTGGGYGGPDIGDGYGSGVGQGGSPHGGTTSGSGAGFGFGSGSGTGSGIGSGSGAGSYGDGSGGGFGSGYGYSESGPSGHGGEGGGSLGP